MKVSLLLGSLVMVASFACGGAPASPPETAAHTASQPANTMPAPPAPANTVASSALPAPASTGVASAKPVVKTPGEATIGDTSTCPISKEEFTISSSSPKAVYKGKTYYFCCAGCEKKFNADPAKYVADLSKK